MSLVNIFVSHHHSDAKRIVDLKDIIEDASNYDIRDSSVYEEKNPNNANNEDYIKSIIGPKIDWASTVIVIVGDKTHKSDWVEWEIERAERGGKTIIGVMMDGTKVSEIPSRLNDIADGIVPWDGKLIARAINGEHLFYDIDGRVSSVNAHREVC